MKHISKAHFLIGIFVPMGLFMVLIVAAMVGAQAGSNRGEPGPLFFVFGLLALISLIISVVYACKLLYRLWAVIQGEDARTTPGKAVGFCFIPLFNFYWIFQAYWGWAVDYNSHVKRHGLDLPPAPEKIGLWLGITQLCGIIPCVNYLSGPANIVLYILFICKGIDSANALLAAQGNQAAPEWPATE